MLKLLVKTWDTNVTNMKLQATLFSVMYEN